MSLRYVTDHSTPFIEGLVDQPLLNTRHDLTQVIEMCFSTGAQVVLLYAANLTPTFFDLSSGDAGEMLQRLRNYGIRLVVVAPAGQVVMSRLFGELLFDERRGAYFDVVESREAACEWIERHTIVR